MFFRDSLSLLVSVLLAAELCAAVPQAHSIYDVAFNVTDNFDKIVEGIEKRQNNIELQILSLSASIVNGCMESSGNWYV
jgi:Mg2+ and Co2+ transporter CorA